MRKILDKNKNNVFLIKSSLRAIETIRGGMIDAIICDRKIQIGDPLHFPHWIIDEIGFLPPYFILSNKIKENDIPQYKNSNKIMGIFKNMKEISQLKEILKNKV